MSKNRYPQPPPYYALYTNEAKSDPDSPDHAFFTPPPPLKQAFRKLGKIYSGTNTKYPIDPANQLFEGDVTKLSSINFSKELRRLNRILLEQYINTLQILSSPQMPLAEQSPDTTVAPYMRSMGVVFDNFTCLLNNLRQNQAKQTTIALLQSQLETAHAKAARMEELSEATKAFLETYGCGVPPYTPVTPANTVLTRGEAHTLTVESIYKEESTTE